ncbi:C-C motif chemokine 14 [Epinephelus lanceolatus]|uniref:chemokine (C-C motif) ligand 38, duplicate 4 n=1 Tax=Epinephelus lanceolatus TaxID=310571 RepID=UPI0014488D7B|nr:chemokine (C-C motif) ligand 38, duplicate 4 [Epinephelus lanceolatus]
MMMMMMKNPITLLTFVLLFSTVTVLAQSGNFSPKECCFDFFSTRLRKDKVVNFKNTDTRCAKEGVLFTVKNGAKFCVDPSEQWVKNIIKAKLKLQTE